MRSSDILAKKQQLDRLFGYISTYNSDPESNIEVKSHLAKYLCVIVCGFLETSVQEIFRSYCRNNSSTNVSNYVEKKLERFVNPNTEMMLQLAGLFSQQWRGNIETEITDELKDSVNSIRGNRISIVHGHRSVTITFERIKKYYEDAISVIEIIENECQ